LLLSVADPARSGARLPEAGSAGLNLLVGKPSQTLPPVMIHD
jgi:hypothetical protein